MWNWLKSFRWINGSLHKMYGEVKGTSKSLKPKEITEITRESKLYPNHTFKIGDGVLVRSNEPDPLWIGHIVRFEDWGKPGQEPIPIVCDDQTGKEYLCSAIIIPFSYGMLDLLNTMPLIEQYNFLAYDHCQIEEKYGIQYKTYNTK